MNLYEVHAAVQIGASSSTHFKATSVLHVSASSIESAASKAVTRARWWAEKEYRWFLSPAPRPIKIDITKLSLVDEDWE